MLHVLVIWTTSPWDSGTPFVGRPNSYDAPRSGLGLPPIRRNREKRSPTRMRGLSLLVKGSEKAKKRGTDGSNVNSWVLRGLYCGAGPEDQALRVKLKAMAQDVCFTATLTSRTIGRSLLPVVAAS